MSKLMLTLVLIAGVACEQDKSREYLIHVDMVDAPAQIGASDTLKARISGVVGPSTCYSLRRVELVRGDGLDRIDVTAVGFHYDPAGFYPCGDMMVYLDEPVVAVPPYAPGTFTIVVHQPGGEVSLVPVEVQQ